MRKLNIFMIFGISLMTIIIPLVSAYIQPFELMDLWTLFVENIFGSFWVAVLFITLFFFIILMLGGISYYTIIIFLMYFLLAMTLGYGYSLFSFLIITFGILYLIWQAYRFMNNQ